MTEVESPRKRFVLMPDSQQLQTFVIYDSLLEQPIGRPCPLKQGMDMADYLNRMTPYCEE